MSTSSFLLPFLAAEGITWSPTALIIAAVIVLVALLVVRFVIKSAFTLVKVAILLLIGAGAYLGLQTVL